MVSDAIGGGPVLVRDGAPVYRSNEGFTTSQLAPRGPRTAVGQRADGGIILLTTDGRQPGYSVGMTNFELAQALVRFGAVRGMALDSGGSSTLAFEGTVLNSPSDGKERAVSTALMLEYYGVYAPPPLVEVVSPNGDGVAETQKLSYKLVRPSTVTTTLTAPDGTIAWQESVSVSRASTTSCFRRHRRLPPGEGSPFHRPPSPLRRPKAAGPSRFRDGRPGSLLHDDAPIRSQLDPCGPARRTCAGRRPEDRREGRDPLVAGTSGSREGDGRDARGSRRAHRVERTDSSPDSRTQLGTGSRATASRSPEDVTSSRVTATNELGVVSLTQPLTVRRVKG